MADTRHDPNILTYNAPEVAEYYAALDYLTPCEKLLFETYLKPSMSILDLGVGGGRTTPYLSAIAARYVGVDYAEEMIAACRKKFPALEFAVGNAADLSSFEPASFDAVVMAFNGMDYVIPNEARYRALREVLRVLKNRGILIFSSHNPRSLWVRPSWNPQRVHRAAESIVRRDSSFFPVLLSSLTALRVSIAAAQALLRTLVRAVGRLPTRAFWRGDGYFTDRAHGGLKTHFASPAQVERELRGFGFQTQQVLGDDYPQPSRLFITDWYYYVFSKIGASEEN